MRERVEHIEGVWAECVWEGEWSEGGRGEACACVVLDEGSGEAREGEKRRIRGRVRRKGERGVWGDAGKGQRKGSRGRPKQVEVRG